MALTITFVLRDFAEWTSIPGPIQIIYALNSFIRFLWVVIWLSLFGIFVYQFYLIIDKLLEVESQIELSFGFQKLRFPIVTLCNQNPYKLAYILSDPRFNQIAHLMENYGRVVEFGYRPISNDHFSFNNASTQQAKDVWAQEMLGLLSKQLDKNVRASAYYMFDEMIQLCRFNGHPCGKSDFTAYTDPIHGKCYRFNAHNGSSHYWSFRAGIPFGLRLLLTTMQKTPQGEQLYLPTTKLAGIRISIDYDNVNPFVDVFGENLLPGREINIAMKLFETQLMQEPYGHCVDTVDSHVYNFYDNERYTLQNCIRSCKQQRCINRCGCADPRYYKPSYAKYCSPKQIECLISLRKETSDYSFNALRDCGCPPPCNEYSIKTQISAATLTHGFRRKKFISGNQFNTVPHSPQRNSTNANSKMKILFQDFSCNQHAATLKHFDGNFAQCAKWFAKNGLIVNLFYKGLNLEQRTQQSSYSLSQASNDLGGQVSLWLGASVISVMEIITLFIMIILFFVYGQKVRVIPTVDEYDKDSRYRHIQQLKTELNIHERMDQELLTRIERQRNNEAARRTEFECQLRKAHNMWSGALSETRLAEAALFVAPANSQTRAAVANARTVLQATRRHLNNMEQERISQFS